ncbi:MAG: VIT1/CCC1 transporter family protein [Patescibacteria group bacterium]
MKKDIPRYGIAQSIREIVFGLEDSLVSTLGALTGIAVGTHNTFFVILSGFVIIASECTSMAAGSYLSSKSAYETERALRVQEGKEFSQEERPVRGAIVMGISYVLGGFIPLLPYFFLSISQAIILSVPLTAIVLFLVGVWSSRYTKRSAIRSGMEMVSVSLIAALFGYLIALSVNWYFGVRV